ncbi:HNH endonuclease signature motif containing protein [Saccharothrix deserti]|uniref:HNH endonuclease signature motif containing protein n=1 Tax=Saccharothrix deserti TaxID=2593674 RepID=UPI001EE3E024|nr:HNH endonuclease signature motif containing protein [Saccharothrix deserti]
MRLRPRLLPTNAAREPGRHQAVDQAGRPVPTVDQPHRTTIAAPAPGNRRRPGRTGPRRRTPARADPSDQHPETARLVRGNPGRSRPRGRTESGTTPSRPHPRPRRPGRDRRTRRARRRTGGRAPHAGLPGGRVEFWGELSAETGARFTAMLEPLSQPRPDGPKDRAHRLGEAFGDLIALASRSEHLPSEAGERPHISITIDLDTLRRGVGHAVLDGDHYLSAAQTRRLACDAKIIPAVMGGDSEVLDLGRTKRTVSVAQRKALHTRDRGCAFPGCPRPPKWCDAHHVKHWADCGDTDLDNLVLLCRTHHSLIHHSRWQISMTGGVPTFIPPRHIDPAQLPRQNLLHRPPIAIAIAA